MQNMSHAVMSQRVEPADSRDDFPTPPWATRALLEHIIGHQNIGQMSCLEPACGAGHMAKVLKEYFAEVETADAYPYGYGEVSDYLESDYSVGEFDWIITNPPFRLAEDFIIRSLQTAKHGVAMLVRSVFLESVGRYNRLFQQHPPSMFAQFVERVPMVRGRLDAKATTATGYAWMVWEQGNLDGPKVVWVPPCRKTLEKPGDYPNNQPSFTW